VQTYKSILYDHEGPIRVITLNRPDVINSIDERMEEEIHEALDVVEADDEARVAIITGAGKGFSAGYDMSASSGGDVDPDSMLPEGVSAAEYIKKWFFHDRNIVRTQTHILELSKPVISAVHGWCMGGGTWIALTSDITLASADAVFAQPEVRHISNTSFLWTLMAGHKNAMRYALTGDHIDAQEAYRIGLVNEVLPDRESMMEEARRLANRISQISPETVMANKYISTLGLEMMGLRNAMTTNWLLSTVAHASQRADYRRKEMLDAAKEEGMRGFLRVRDAPFQPEPFGPRSKRDNGEQPG